MKKIYLVATIVAIIAGFATYFFAVEIKKNSSIKDVEKASVVISVMDIPADTILTADMLTVVSLPVTSVTGGTASNVNDVVGYMTLQPIATGEQLLASRLALVGMEGTKPVKGSNSRLSYKLEKGRYAYSISIDPNQGISGFLKEGDYIDIYQIGSGTDGITSLLLQNVRILKVSNYVANLAQSIGTEITSYSELILDLSRDQLIKLSDAQSNSLLKFALVPYAVGAGIADDLEEGMSEKEIVTNAPGIVVTVPVATSTTTAAE